jgi:hypothetical protein
MRWFTEFIEIISWCEKNATRNKRDIDPQPVYPSLQFQTILEDPHRVTYMLVLQLQLPFTRKLLSSLLKSASILIYNRPHVILEII